MLDSRPAALAPKAAGPGSVSPETVGPEAAGITGLDIEILGLPQELGAASRGTLMGPDALRTAGLARALAELGHRVSDHGNLHDAPPADVAMDPDAAARCRFLPEISGWIREIHGRAHAMAARGGVPIFLGGDHAISMGTVSAVARHCAATGRELAVLWVDAHPDYNVPATSPSGNLHGMSLAFLAGEPVLAPILDRPVDPVAHANLHVFGARSIDPGERARLRAHGVDVVDMRQIDERGVAALMAERIARWQEKGVWLHVSFDVDFLDPEVAPGTGTVVPGGATYREAHLVMEMLSDAGLVGSLDVVELNPFLDTRGRTALAATELVASLFGRRVLDRKPGATSAA
ncbi:MAG: arginase [Amaricoccus sp.]|uniref:arginase n=1 Tax=Amaricoccus sp. TaxID=1872485 RepID=UPI0039E43967